MVPRPIRCVRGPQSARACYLGAIEDSKCRSSRRALPSAAGKLVAVQGFEGRPARSRTPTDGNDDPATRTSNRSATTAMANTSRQGAVRRAGARPPRAFLEKYPCHVADRGAGEGSRDGLGNSALQGRERRRFGLDLRKAARGDAPSARGEPGREAPSIRRAALGAVFVGMLQTCVGLAAEPAAPAAATAAPLTLTPCDVPGLQGKARCGTYEVWENRETRSGRRIPLRVLVLPATGADRVPDPFTFFHGGPGAAATE